MKKIGLISLALVLALGVLGVGYAMWDKTLDIEGTIGTGEVNMYFSDPAGTDPPGTLDPYSPLIPNTYPQKDAADTTTWVDAVDNQLVHILIDDGYPYYHVAVHATAWNNGTIPVILESIVVDPQPACVLIDASDGIGEQLDPGEHRDNTIFIDILQCADENTYYYFTVAFHYVQFNEYP